MRNLLIILVLLSATTACGSGPEGERLAYVVGCVNCHHQTPKDIIDAPPLTIVQAYSLDEFSRLLRTGVTLSSRDLVDIGSIMGIVAVEQFAHLTDSEILAIYTFLQTEWTVDRANEEESKIPRLYKDMVESTE